MGGLTQTIGGGFLSFTSRGFLILLNPMNMSHLCGSRETGMSAQCGMEIAFLIRQWKGLGMSDGG
jgi:hypothetical protein